MFVLYLKLINHLYIYIFYYIHITIMCQFLIAMQHPADRGHTQEETSD